MDVGIVNLQPIFNCQLGGGRSLSLGVNYGQVMSLWGQKWRPNVEFTNDFQDLTGTPKVTLRAGMTVLLPSF